MSVEPKTKVKRAISGYHVFVGQQLSNADYTKTTFAAQMKAIGADWKAMPDTEKAKFQNEAARTNRQRESGKGKATKTTKSKSKSKSASKSKPAAKTKSASKSKPKSQKR